MLFIDVLSAATGVGACGCPIHAKEVRMYADFWPLSNNPPNSAFVVDAMSFLNILYSKCTGLFPGCIDFIDMLGFWPRKKIHLICFVRLVPRCILQQNMIGESFCLFYIMVLRLDLARCNLIILGSILLFLLLALSVTLPGSPMELILLGH